MSTLADKVAIVTGASKGIGAAIAQHLGAAGAAVAVNYASDRDGADRVVGAFVRQGGKALAVQADVAKQADVYRLFSDTVNTFGRLDILVNNAGIFEFLPLEQITQAHFRRQFDTNVLGVILASQEALRHFGPAGGAIIKVSSITGETLEVAGGLY